MPLTMINALILFKYSFWFIIKNKKTNYFCVVFGISFISWKPRIGNVRLCMYVCIYG